MLWKSVLVAAGAMLLSPSLLLAMPHGDEVSEAVTIVDLPGGPTLSRSAGAYSIDLGNFAQGDVVFIPRAFALVNEGEVAIRVTGIFADGALASMISVYVDDGVEPSPAEVLGGRPDRSNRIVLWDGYTGDGNGRDATLGAGDGDPSTAGGVPMRKDAPRDVWELAGPQEGAEGAGEDILFLAVVVHAPKGVPDGRYECLIQIAMSF